MARLNIARFAPLEIESKLLCVVGLVCVLTACSADTRTADGGVGAGGLPDALGAVVVSGIYDEPVQLLDGAFVGEPFVPGGASRPTVTLLPAPHANVDVDGDGERDWLVVLAESSGGSGTFYYLAAIRMAGSLVRNLATVPLGDRVDVQSIVVDGQEIRVELMMPEGDDPMCCPSATRTSAWQWTASNLHPVERFAGHLVYGHESREFFDCDGRSRYWVADATDGALPREYEALIFEPYQPVFVEITASRLAAPDAGFAKDFAEQLRVTSLRRAEVEGWGCGLDLADANFRALGVEPFWRVDVGSEELTFSLAGDEPLSFTRDAYERDGVRQTWRARSASGALVLTLREERCVDPMSGNLFAYRAEVEHGGKDYSGCALAPLPS